jgi:methylmalonyl-CoA/ethylmalonyl-CoA epimerase
LKHDAVFTETLQIGIVVRDIEATIRRYEDDFGIGPWQTHEIDSADVKDLREYGQPAVAHAWRVSVTKIGSVMWELIQPLDQAGIYAHFLAEKGEGVHHIALATPNFDELVARQTERGRELLGSGELGGARVAYLATDGDLGVITEIHDATTADDAVPDQQAARVALSGPARRLVEGANQAHLATLLPDGAPHSVPLWIGLEGDDLAVLTDPNSR